MMHETRQKYSSACATQICGTNDAKECKQQMDMVVCGMLHMALHLPSTHEVQPPAVQMQLCKPEIDTKQDMLLKRC